MILLTYASMSSAECMLLASSDSHAEIQKNTLLQYVNLLQSLILYINILDLFAIFCGVKPTSSFHIKLRPAFCPSFLRLCFVESQARTTLQQSFAHRYRGSNAICRTKAVNFQSCTINWVDTPCVVASLTDKLWNQFRKKAPYQHTARIKGKTKQYKQ